jgi:ribonuclease Y
MEVFAIVAAIAGLGAGYGAATTMNKKKHGDIDAKTEEKLAKAKKEAEEVISRAKADADRLADEARAEEKSLRREILETEKRLVKREENLDSKLEEIDKRKDNLSKSEKDIEDLKTQIHQIKDKQMANLEKIGKLKKDEAKEKIMQMTERDIKSDLTELVAKLQEEAKENAEENAKLIIVESMERLASDVTTERTVTAVPMPEDMKGRIIGKEGRNIQAIQRLTGVDVMVDETPGVAILSCFDPIRRQQARIVMETLIKDGRVHPGAYRRSC